jgi:hypothetical protein
MAENMLGSPLYPTNSRRYFGFSPILLTAKVVWVLLRILATEEVNTSFPSVTYQQQGIFRGFPCILPRAENG